MRIFFVSQRREQEKIDRINAIHRKEQDDVLCSLEAFAEHQRKTEEGVFKRIESVTENRERKLKEMRDKLKAKRDHEEQVRQRKKMVLENGVQQDGEEEDYLEGTNR